MMKFSFDYDSNYYCEINHDDMEMTSEVLFRIKKQNRLYKICAIIRISKIRIVMSVTQKTWTTSGKS